MTALVDWDDVVNDWTHRIGRLQSFVDWLTTDTTDVLCLQDDLLVLVKRHTMGTLLVCSN